MLSLIIQFSECDLVDSLNSESNIGTVNHAMFYVLGSHSIDRVHCLPNDNGKYYVENKPQRHKVPRNIVGRGIEISLMPVAKEMNAQDFAEMLAKLPAPLNNEGGCQWWILKNAEKMEKTGFIEAGTLRKLLADTRMDSPRLMEFEQLRDELQKPSLPKPNEVSGDTCEIDDWISQWNSLAVDDSANENSPVSEKVESELSC